MSNHQSIHITDLDFIATTNLQSSVWQPILLTGSPGIAKTQWCKNGLRKIYADFLNIGFEDVGVVTEKPARRDAAELAGAGLPYKQADGSHIFEFTLSPVLAKIQRSGKQYGILLWDEATAAGVAEQKVICDSCDPEEHEIGGHKIPAGWIVVLTGNRAKDKAGSQRALSQLINRVMTYNVEFDINGWVRWAEENGVNPVVIECAKAYADQNFFADSVPSEDTAYCTPRSLVRAAAHLDAYMMSDEFSGHIPPIVEKMLASNIGADAANILSQWMAQRDEVPSAEEIINYPETARVSDQTGFQMIAANSAMAHVNDARSATAVLHYIVRLRTDLQVSLGTKLMGISTRKGWTVTDPLAAAFIAKFHELIPLAMTDR
jgi:hypothetical protein